MPKIKSLKVLELFAGVGGFRLGLEGYKGGKSSTSNYNVPLDNKIPYQIMYSNQWEPSSKIQHANNVYVSRFGSTGHFSHNIELLKSRDIEKKCDLLVGGFPCPDFSVGSLLKYSKGLDGKKGELWFQITRLLKELQKAKRKPDYLLFENVDRMLKSPASDPGKDFDSILHSLNELKYNVEWKVINSSDYGFPQKRKRVFIFCFDRNSPIAKLYHQYNSIRLLENKGVISSAFHSKIKDNINYKLNLGLQNNCAFNNCGLMIDGEVEDYDGSPDYQGPYKHLKHIRFRGLIPESFFIKDKDLAKWSYAKSAKKILRRKGNFEYMWSEGKIPFPDNLNAPSRTIITSEGGSSVSRTRHVIKDKKMRYRRLLPIELERLNMFPDNFTLHSSTTDNKRAFLMGNALVVGIVEKIGTSLSDCLFRLG